MLKLEVTQNIETEQLKRAFCQVMAAIAQGKRTRFLTR